MSMEQHRSYKSVVAEYQNKIWLFWLSLFWLMYATVIGRGNLPPEFTGAPWRIWAVINGIFAMYFFLHDPHNKVKWFVVRISMVSVVSFCVVRSILYLMEDRYQIVPVWGLIATLSLHAYTIGKRLREIDEALCDCHRRLNDRIEVSTGTDQKDPVPTPWLISPEE